MEEGKGVAAKGEMTFRVHLLAVYGGFFVCMFMGGAREEGGGAAALLATQRTRTETMLFYILRVRDRPSLWHAPAPKHPSRSLV